MCNNCPPPYTYGCQVASRGETGYLPLQRRGHRTAYSCAVTADIKAIDAGPVAVVAVSYPSTATGPIDVPGAQRAGHVCRRNQAVPDGQTISFELQRRCSCNHGAITVCRLCQDKGKAVIIADRFDYGMSIENGHAGGADCGHPFGAAHELCGAQGQRWQRREPFRSTCQIDDGHDFATAFKN